MLQPTFKMIVNYTLAVEETIDDVKKNMENKNSIFYYDKSRRIMGFSLNNEPNMMRRELLHQLQREIILKFREIRMKVIDSEKYDMFVEEQGHNLIYWIFRKMRLLYLCNLLNAIFQRASSHPLRTKLLPNDFMTISRFYDWEYKNCDLSLRKPVQFFLSIKSSFIEMFISTGQMENFNYERLRLNDFLTPKSVPFVLFSDAVDSKLKYIQASLILPDDTAGFIKISERNSTFFQKKKSEMKDINKHIQTFGNQNPFKLMDKESLQKLKNLIENSEDNSKKIFPSESKTNKKKKKKARPAPKAKRAKPLGARLKIKASKTIKESIKRKNIKSKSEIRKLALADDQNSIETFEIESINFLLQIENKKTTALSKRRAKNKKASKAKRTFGSKDFGMMALKSSIETKSILKKNETIVGCCPETKSPKGVVFEDGKRPIKDKQLGNVIQRPHFNISPKRCTLTRKLKKSETNKKKPITPELVRTSTFMRNLKIYLKPQIANELNNYSAKENTLASKNKYKSTTGKQGPKSKANIKSFAKDPLVKPIKKSTNVKSKKGSNEQTTNKSKNNVKKKSLPSVKKKINENLEEFSSKTISGNSELIKSLQHIIKDVIPDNVSVKKDTKPINIANKKGLSNSKETNNLNSKSDNSIKTEDFQSATNNVDKNVFKINEGVQIQFKPNKGKNFAFKKPSLKTSKKQMIPTELESSFSNKKTSIRSIQKLNTINKNSKTSLPPLTKTNAILKTDLNLLKGEVDELEIITKNPIDLLIKNPKKPSVVTERPYSEVHETAGDSNKPSTKPIERIRGSNIAFKLYKGDDSNWKIKSNRISPSKKVSKNRYGNGPDNGTNKKRLILPHINSLNQNAVKNIGNEKKIDDLNKDVKNKEVSKSGFEKENQERKKVPLNINIKRESNPLPSKIIKNEEKYTANGDNPNLQFMEDADEEEHIINESTKDIVRERGLKQRKKKFIKQKRDQLFNNSSTEESDLMNLRDEHTNKGASLVSNSSRHKRKKNSSKKKNYAFNKLKTVPISSKLRSSPSINCTKNGFKNLKETAKQIYNDEIQEVKMCNLNNLQLCLNGEINMRSEDFCKYGVTRYAKEPSFNNFKSTRGKIVGWIKRQITPCIRMNRLDSNASFLHYITARIYKALDQKYERNISNRVKESEINAIIKNMRTIIRKFPTR